MRLCLCGPLRQLLLLALLYLKVVCVLCDNFCGALSRAARALSCTFALSISLCLCISLLGGDSTVWHMCEWVSIMHTYTYICMCAYIWVLACTYALGCSVIVRERERERAPVRDTTPTHSHSLSHATQTFPVRLITTRALFPSSSSNLSYSRILLSGVCCTYFFVIVYLRVSISWDNIIKKWFDKEKPW